MACQHEADSQGLKLKSCVELLCVVLKGSEPHNTRDDANNGANNDTESDANDD